MERSQRDAAARHMAALPPLRADVEHDAPKKLNDWLDHLSTPDWKAIGSRVKGRADATRLRRQERAGQREQRRIEQAKDPQAHQAPDGATPPAVDALNTGSTDERPAQESAAAPRTAAEAPAAGSPAAGTAGPSPAAKREPADTQPAGAAQQPAADLDLAALVESARAAIHARVTAAHIHPYTMLSVDAGPAIGLSGEASTPALLASPDDGGNGPSTNDGGSAGTDGATNDGATNDGGGNGVVPPGNRIRGRGSTGAGNAGRVDAASDDASGPGFAAVARSIVTGVTSPRPTDEELRDASPFWVDDDEPLYVPPYNLPSRTPDPPENRQDRLRRAVVAGVAVVALLLGFLGLGLFGGGTAHSDPGSPFLPRAALLSPGVDSFMIWGLLFCWVVLFAVYQWHPTQRSSPRQRDLGYPTAGAALLGALWLLAARAEMAATAMWIAIVLTGVLVYCLRLMNQRTARDNAERICVDAPTALFLGWMLTVLPMSVGVYLTSRGADFLLPGSGWAVLAIIGATWAAASFSMSERGRIVLALGFGWGLFWIMLVRLLGPLFSTPVAIVAGLCAFIVLLATENRRYQIGHAERRAARGQRTEF